MAPPSRMSKLPAAVLQQIMQLLGTGPAADMAIRQAAWVARCVGRGEAAPLGPDDVTALAEITVLHMAFRLRPTRRGRVWTVASWLLAATHLGMLEHRRSIGLATTVTLTRANLPACARTRWLPLLALTTDIADGRAARALGTESPFGAAADAIADAAFWTWYTLRHEPSRAVRTAAVLAWLAPVVTVTTLSVCNGRMVDAPRPALLRPAAAMQVIVTVRALSRAAGQPS